MCRRRVGDQRQGGGVGGEDDDRHVRLLRAGGRTGTLDTLIEGQAAGGATREQEGTDGGERDWADHGPSSLARREWNDYTGRSKRAEPHESEVLTSDGARGYTAGTWFCVPGHVRRYTRLGPSGLGSRAAARRPGTARAAPFPWPMAVKDPFLSLATGKKTPRPSKMLGR